MDKGGLLVTTAQERREVNQLDIKISRHANFISSVLVIRMLKRFKVILDHCRVTFMTNIVSLLESRGVPGSDYFRVLIPFANTLVQTR